MQDYRDFGTKFCSIFQNILQQVLTRKNKLDTSIDWSGDWRYIAPDVFYGEGAHPAETGELAFAVEFNKKFYNLIHIKNNFYDNL